MTQLEALPLEAQNIILSKRLRRAKAALEEAETVLAARLRELYSANEALEDREASLVEALDIGSRQLLRAQSAGNIATIYGEKGGSFTASRNAASLLGLPSEKDASLDTLVAALHPLDRDRIMRVGVRFFTAMDAGVDHMFEHRIRRFDNGEVRWLRWFLRRERATETTRAATYGTVQDITEPRANARRVTALNLMAERRIAELDRLAGELEAERTRTADALAHRDRFLATLAHELRTPLATLTGAVDLLREGASDLSLITEATNALGTMAERLFEEVEAPGAGADPAAAAEKQDLPLTSDGLPPRVLVAEDTASNQYVILRQLAALGCETVAVSNGADAVEAVRRDHFDLVLMDVMMPLMTGEEATQAIRALPGPAARTPIVGVTAHSLQAERERLLASGMTACLAKPVRRETLETALRTALIAGAGGVPLAARFDEDIFRRAFMDLPASYRERMRDAVRADISRYAQDFLAAADAAGDAASRAAHSLKGVALNVGALGVVEEMTAFREALANGEVADIEPFRAEVAASLLALDDLYGRLVAQ